MGMYLILPTIIWQWKIRHLRFIHRCFFYQQKHGVVIYNICLPEDGHSNPFASLASPISSRRNDSHLWCAQKSNWRLQYIYLPGENVNNNPWIFNCTVLLYIIVGYRSHYVRGSNQLLKGKCLGAAESISNSKQKALILKNPRDLLDSGKQFLTLFYWWSIWLLVIGGAVSIFAEHAHVSLPQKSVSYLG